MPTENLSEDALERVIRKIKRCMALAQSSNETEAATALRQAQSLMRKYQLTETDIQLSDVGEVESTQSRANRRPIWDRDLSAVVAKVFDCKALSLRHWCVVSGRRVDRATFVGITPAQHIALYAYEALLTKMKQARKEYVASVRAGKFRSSYSPETAGEHFAIAWVGQVYGKLKRLVPQGDSDLQIEQASDRRELAVFQKEGTELIEQYLASQEIGKHRKRTERELDLNAQIAGMLSGLRADLHIGLATGANGTLRISKG